MAEAKAKALSGAELLQLLACEPETYEVQGVTVELRALTFTEVQKLAKIPGDDNVEANFQALRLGLVSPQLTDAEFEQLRNVKAGALMKMAQRVMLISGMTDEEEGGSPLGGGASSLAASKPPN